VNDAMAIYVPGPLCQRRFAKLRLVNTIGITPWKNRDIAPMNAFTVVEAISRQRQWAVRVERRASMMAHGFMAAPYV
jgi:hypothetical protein